MFYYLKFRKLIIFYYLKKMNFVAIKYDLMIKN